MLLIRESLPLFRGYKCHGLCSCMLLVKESQLAAQELMVDSKPDSSEGLSCMLGG
jgi:hypothetical protein